MKVFGFNIGGNKQLETQAPAAPVAEAKLKAPSYRTQELSVDKLVTALEGEINSGGLDFKDAKLMMSGLAGVASGPGSSFTLDQLVENQAKTKDLLEFITGQNDARKAAGLNPKVEDLQLQLGLAEQSLGAIKLEQFLLYSAKTGELSKLAADVKPGATEQLGAAFGA